MHIQLTMSKTSSQWMLNYTLLGQDAQGLTLPFENLLYDYLSLEEHAFLLKLEHIASLIRVSDEETFLGLSLEELLNVPVDTDLEAQNLLTALTQGDYLANAFAMPLAMVHFNVTANGFAVYTSNLLNKPVYAVNELLDDFNNELALNTETDFLDLTFEQLLQIPVHLDTEADNIYQSILTTNSTGDAIGNILIATVNPLIQDAFAQQLDDMLAMDEGSFIQHIEQLSQLGGVNSEENFLDVAFEDLFNVPVVSSTFDTGEIVATANTQVESQSQNSTLSKSGTNSFSDENSVVSESNVDGGGNSGNVDSQEQDTAIATGSTTPTPPSPTLPPPLIALVNSAPIANTDIYNVTEGVLFVINGLLDNDTDIDDYNDPLTLTAINGRPFTLNDPITLPSGNTLWITNIGVGAFNFMPFDTTYNLAAGQTITETVQYTVSDGVYNATGTAEFIISGLNTAPLLTNDSYSATEGVTLSPVSGLLSNDTDPDSVAISVTHINGNPVTVNTNIVLANGATFKITDLNTGDFEYTMADGTQPLFAGDKFSDSFTYTVSDGTDTTVATAQIEITGSFSTIVTRTQDDIGGETLREAIISANTNGNGLDTINLAAGTYTLALAGTGEDLGRTGDLDITDDLTITGAGSDVTFIDADTIDRVFEVFSGVTLTLEDVTITGGSTAGTGGAIANAGNIITNGVVFTNNTATGFGGAIYNTGTTTFNSTTFDANTSNTHAGAIYNTSGTVNINDSLLTNNIANGFGGAIHSEGVGSTLNIDNSQLSGNKTQGALATGAGAIGILGGTSVVQNSTFTQNESNSSGAAINIAGDGQLALMNSTISGNTAGSSGGGITNQDTAIINIANSTITDNNALANIGEGIHNTSTAPGSTITSSIVFDNDGSQDINANGNLISLGDNIIGTEVGAFILIGSDSSADPLLQPLAQNGGQTTLPDGTVVLTHYIDSTSPAIDAGNSSDAQGGSLTADQTGSPYINQADIGAIERLPEPNLTITITQDIVDTYTTGQTAGQTWQEFVTFGDGELSLREAFILVNISDELGDTLVLGAGKNYILDELGQGEDGSELGDLDFNNITFTLNITGGVGTTIDADGIDRVLQFGDKTTVNISDITITGGDNVTQGSGIFTEATLTLDNVSVTANNATLEGGGIYNDGTLTLINGSSVTGNTAPTGAGVYNKSGTTLYITDGIISGNSGVDGAGIYIINDQNGYIKNTVINNNTATGIGGGINFAGNVDYSISGAYIHSNTATTGGGINLERDAAIVGGITVVLENSTVSDNKAVNGAGINVGLDSNIILTNASVSQNTATGDGGGVNLEANGSLTIANSTIGYNTANGIGDGIASSSTSTNNTITSSIVHSNDTAGSNEDINISLGSLGSDGNNIIGNPLNNFSADGTDLIGVDPLLTPLNINTVLQLLPDGSAMPTHTVEEGSPAINAGNDSDGQGGTVTGDQLGLTGDESIDIGSFEYGIIVTTNVDVVDTYTLGQTAEQTWYDFVTNGDHVLSLREGIILANIDDTLGNTVYLDDNITYDLSITGQGENTSLTGDLDITNTTNQVIIQGGENTIINGNNVDRVFHVLSGADVIFNDLTIRDGRTSTGGGIYNQGGTVIVNNSLITSNDATSIGGGIYNSGVFTLNQSQVASNRTDAPSNPNDNSGGIFNNSQMNIISSIINHNASQSHGGIRHSGNRLFIDNSYIHSNNGGNSDGIYINSGATNTTIINSTIANHGNTAIQSFAPHVIFYNNTVANNGIGIQNSQNTTRRGQVDISNSTFVDNGVAFVIGTSTISSSVASSIFHDNNTDISGSSSRIQSIGSNIITGNSSMTPHPTDSTADPLLSPLQDNGGTRPLYNNTFVPTYIPLDGSPAIDAGITIDGAGGNITADQRGLFFIGEGVDIGANEGSNFILVTTEQDIVDTYTPGDTFNNLYTSFLADGEISLREAIILANKSTQDIDILLPDTVTNLTLSLTGNDDTAQSGDLDITNQNINIRLLSGVGANIDASSLGDRAFHVLSGANFEIDTIGITGGNSSTDGGAILNEGDLLIRGALIKGNTAASNGGAISAQGNSTTIISSYIQSNIASNGSGGGIEGINILVDSSTLAGNMANNGSGGGISVSDSSSVLVNTTVSGNTANVGGGVDSLSGINIANSTITLNTAISNGDGVSGIVDIASSIIYGNGTQDIDGVFNSLGNNLYGSQSGIYNAGTGDITGQDPNLQSLAENGNLELMSDGNTAPTHAIDVSSPATDAGNTQNGQGGNITTDTRGAHFINQADIGAVEAQLLIVTTHLDILDNYTLGQTAQETWDDFVANGDGLLSLREAVIIANIDDSLGDTIYLADNTNYILQLLSGAQDTDFRDLDITNTNNQVTIQGGNGSVINAREIGRVFQVSSGADVVFNDVTLQNGLDGDGGGIHTAGTVEFNRVILENNTTNSRGGGIFNSGILTINQSILTGNSAVNPPNPNERAGAIFNTNQTDIIDTIVRNSSAQNVGAIQHSGNRMYIDNSYIHNNSGGSAGGLYIAGGSTGTTIMNTTFADNGTGIQSFARHVNFYNNTMSGHTGIAYLNSQNTTRRGQVDISNSTFADNNVAFSIGTTTLPHTIQGSIFYDNNTNISGSSSLINSLGYNIIDGSSSMTPDPTDQNTDPLLGSLQNNGGTSPLLDGSYVPTYSLLPGSPAIDQGTTNNGAGGTLTTDQRGALFVGAPDIGSFEFGGVPPIILDLDGDGVELVSAINGITVGETDYSITYLGWVAPDDAILVYDENGDGTVSGLNELALAAFHEDANTDLEGLKLAFDSNQDNLFNADDDLFNNFMFWQDLNQDGISQGDELTHLFESDITALYLESDNNLEFIEGNIVMGYSTFERTDGSTGQLADTVLTTFNVLQDNVDTLFSAQVDTTNTLDVDAVESDPLLNSALETNFNEEVYIQSTPTDDTLIINTLDEF